MWHTNTASAAPSGATYSIETLFDWTLMIQAACATLCAVAMLANLSTRTESVCMMLLCRYAAGATIQILLFGILAIEIKRKAPTAHTMLEIIRARWGTLAHIVCTALIIASSETVIMSAITCLPLDAVC